MSTLQAAVLLAVVLLALAAPALAVRHWLRRRHQSLVILAGERSLHYTERDDRQVRPVGYPFGLGQDQRARNVLTGEVGGRSVVAFDYTFRVPVLTGWSLTRRFSVVVVTLPARLPELEIVELDWRDKPTTFLGLDLFVTRNADFNARFRVRAADRDLADQVLGKWTQDALLRQPSLRLRLLGAEAWTWKPGRLTAQDLDRHLASIAALVDGIPPTVWIERRRPA